MRIDLRIGHTALLGTTTIHGNVPSSDVTWLHTTADVCVKCSITFAILGHLCFLRDTMEEIGSAMGVVNLHIIQQAEGKCTQHLSLWIAHLRIIYIA